MVPLHYVFTNINYNKLVRETMKNIVSIIEE